MTYENFELKNWMKRHNLTREKAAQLLCLSIGGLSKNIYGQTPVSRQTTRIMELYDAVIGLQTK